MALTATTEVVQLKTDADGVVRLGDTRVTLDTVVSAFNLGATAEEIAQQYPTLQLADVYQVIGYYLRRQAEVEAYLAQRAMQAGRVREQNQKRHDPQGVRGRLLARSAQRES